MPAIARQKAGTGTVREEMIWVKCDGPVEIFGRLCEVPMIVAIDYSANAIGIGVGRVQRQCFIERRFRICEFNYRCAAATMGEVTMGVCLSCPCRSVCRIKPERLVKGFDRPSRILPIIF